MVSSTPRPHFTPGKDPVPIVQEAGWAPGPVWTGGKSRPHRDTIPVRSARSSVAIPTEVPGPRSVSVIVNYSVSFASVLAHKITCVSCVPVILYRLFILSDKYRSSLLTSRLIV